MPKDDRTEVGRIIISERARWTADKRTSDRANPMNERDIHSMKLGKMAPLRDYIPSPGMFRDDGTIFLIFLHGSTRSPLIGNRCAFNLPASALRFLTQITSGIFGYFRHVFHVSREIDSHEGKGGGEDSCTSRRRNYDALSETENEGVIHHRIDRETD